jgi:hypothetical protein
MTGVTDFAQTIASSTHPSLTNIIQVLSNNWFNIIIEDKLPDIMLMFLISVNLNYVSKAIVSLRSHNRGTRTYMYVVQNISEEFVFEKGKRISTSRIWCKYQQPRSVTSVFLNAQPSCMVEPPFR